MELIPDESFVTQWLEKPDFDESTVVRMLKNQFNYFTNRRQIDKFHSWFFGCSSSVDSPFGSVYIPQEFRILYGEVIIQSPPLQTIQTWKLFLEQDIIKSPVLMELFICFLSHVRVCDDLMPKHTLLQQTQCIESTKDILLNLPFTEIQSHDQLFLVLNLAYSWGNFILLSYSYDKEKPILQFSQLYWYDLQPIHSYYDDQVWKSIVNHCLTETSELAEIIFKLLIQKLSILTKAMYIESDLEIQQLCKENVECSVTRILKKIKKELTLLDHMDVWRFSSFVPDNKMDKWTDIIIQRVVQSEEESISSSIIFTIKKGCEKATFVSSVIDSIINIFGDRFDGRNLAFERLKRDGSIKLSISALKTLQILKHLPLEHLQNELQLKCSTFLILLGFSVGLRSEIGRLCVDFMLPILESNHPFMFFQVFPAQDFCSIIFKGFNEEDVPDDQKTVLEDVPDYLKNFISLVIKKYFETATFGKETRANLMSIYENVKEVNPLVRLKLTIVLLERSMDKDKEFSRHLAEHLITLLSSGDLDYSGLYDALITILDYLPRELSTEHLDLFMSSYSKTFKNLCESISSVQYFKGDDGRFESAIQFMYLSCMKSNQVAGLLTTKTSKKLWSSLLENRPSSETNKAIKNFINHKNTIEFYKFVPAISKCIFKNFSEDFSKFDDRLNRCFEALRNGAVVEKFTILRALKGLFDREWTKKSSKEKRMYQFIDSHLDDLLSIVNSLIVQQYTQSAVIPYLIELACDLIKHILSVGHDLLISPRLHSCLQTCSFVLGLQKLVKSAEDSSKILTSCQSILYQFFADYHDMTASTIFLTKDTLLIYLTSLIQISDQSIFISYSNSEQLSLVEVASNYNKLIFKLTNDYADDLAPYAPDLINGYISLNHKYNIHSLVKQKLTPCIYRLFNVIKSNPNWKDTNAMIHVRLPESQRQFFQDLYQNYEKFYVFKGRF